MRAQRHRRQFRVRLALALRPRCGGEQRQILLIADPVQRLDRPQRLAPVEPERAERVGVGEPLQSGERNPAAQPQIAHGIEAGAAPLDQPAHLLLARA